MNGDLVVNEWLAWAVGWTALASFGAVAAWVSARTKEREAFYKAEAIKRIAEMQGKPDEAVLQVLREAVASRPSTAWMGPSQARSYYRSETIKRIAETQGSDALLEYLRQQDKSAARRQRGGIILGGMICAGVGIALMVFLRALPAVAEEGPVYLVGLIPLVVGAALLGYALFLAPKE